MRHAVHEGSLGDPVSVELACGFEAGFPQRLGDIKPLPTCPTPSRWWTVIDVAQWLTGTVESVGPVHRDANDHVELILNCKPSRLGRAGSPLGVLPCHVHLGGASRELSITVHCRDADARFSTHSSCWQVMWHGSEEWNTVVAANLRGNEIEIVQANRYLDQLHDQRRRLASLDELQSAQQVLQMVNSE